MADYGVHFDKTLDNKIKAEAQRKAMDHYNWSVDDFIKRFGRSYI
jgi:hypothetical protein